jgi:hypothetical protein
VCLKGEKERKKRGKRGRHREKELKEGKNNSKRRLFSAQYSAVAPFLFTAFTPAPLR